MTDRDRSLDSDTVDLRIDSTGESISFWTSQSQNSEFLTPTDAWSFDTGDAGKIKELREKLKPGARVSLVINDKVQASGHVSGPVVHGDKNGTKCTVKGYDTLKPMVDAGIDPKLSFGKGTTLLSIVSQVAEPFGFKRIATTDIANRRIMTGNLKRNTRVTTVPVTIRKGSFDNETGLITYSDVVGTQPFEYDPTKPKFLKDFKLDHYEPHPGEGCFETLAKLAKRFKLWLWASADGDTLILDVPDFEQPALQALYRTLDRNGVESGEIEINNSEQPSVLIGQGTSYGGKFAGAPMKLAMVNELTGYDPATNTVRADVMTAVKRWKGLRTFPLRPQLLRQANDYSGMVARPVYLQDDESKTQGQLEGFLRHQMAKQQSKAQVVKQTVRGHTQAGLPWAVNTNVDVYDTTLGIDERLWVRERTFRKSNDGTFTDLVLIRPYHLDLGG